MSQEKENYIKLFIIAVPVLLLILFNQWFYFHDYFGLFFSEKVNVTSLAIAKKIHIIKGSYILLIAVASFLTASITDRKSSLLPYVILCMVFVILLFVGFTSIPSYNLYIYPLTIVLSGFFTIKTVQFIKGEGEEDKESLHAKTKSSNTSFKLATTKGYINITRPEMGIAIEGGAGAGKSVLIKNILSQAGRKGYAGVLYDFEGDCREKGGAELTRTILSSVKKYNSGPKKEGSLGFAYLNFGDPSRTVRVNPLNPRYIESALDLNQFATTLMKNLEPDWLKRTDFWAQNAINYTYGILQRLYNDRSFWNYLTVPHLAMIATYDYETVLNWILQDKSLEKRIMPLYVAYKEQAKSQIAGAVSSAALPIVKLLEPEIFYALSPQEEFEEFDLDITNSEKPVFFSIGTIPKNKHALGPVCSLILLVCMNNMNQFGKRRSLLVVDELSTMFIPNLDEFPATARKKGCSTLLAWQSFKQLEFAYGKEKAMITRDNLSNQFVGKGRNLESAEQIVKFFGKRDVKKQNYSSSDSGDSISFNTTKEEYLQPSDIVNQPIGHFTGVLAEGKPPTFHSQFKNFEPDLVDIPIFSKKWNTTNDELDKEMMKKEVFENYLRIEREVESLLSQYQKQ